MLLSGERSLTQAVRYKSDLVRTALTVSSVDGMLMYRSAIMDHSQKRRLRRAWHGTTRSGARWMLQ